MFDIFLCDKDRAGSFVLRDWKINGEKREESKRRVFEQRYKARLRYIAKR